MLAFNSFLLFVLKTTKNVVSLSSSDALAYCLFAYRVGRWDPITADHVFCSCCNLERSLRQPRRKSGEVKEQNRPLRKLAEDGGSQWQIIFNFKYFLPCNQQNRDHMTKVQYVCCCLFWDSLAVNLLSRLGMRMCFSSSRWQDSIISGNYTSAVYPQLY